MAPSYRAKAVVPRLLNIGGAAKVDVDTVIFVRHVIAVNMADSSFNGQWHFSFQCYRDALRRHRRAHSWLGETRILGPLYARPNEGILASEAARAIIRAVWHLPSIAWVAVGLALLINGRAPNAPLFICAILIFASAGVGNIAALRAPHPGGIMMLAAATLASIQFYQTLR